MTDPAGFALVSCSRSSGLLRMIARLPERLGSSIDNAMTESFFVSTETGSPHRTCLTRVPMPNGMFYILWRRHPANDQLSPIEHERGHAEEFRRRSLVCSGAGEITIVRAC